MFFDFINKYSSSVVVISGNFSIASAVRSTGGKHKYVPRIIKKNKIKNINCKLILDHRSYDTAIAEMPYLPKGDLKKAIFWEAVKLFGDKDDNFLFDYYKLPSNNKIIVNIVAVKKNYINYVNRKAELENIIFNKITIPEMIYKSATFETLNGNRFCVVIANQDIGKVVVIENGEVYFSRKFIISHDERIEHVDYESILLLELQRSLDYCERQHQMIIPTQFFVLGDAVNSRLVSLIKDSVSHNVHVDFPWSNDFFDGREMSTDHGFLLSTSCMKKGF